MGRWTGMHPFLLAGSPPGPHREEVAHSQGPSCRLKLAGSHSGAWNLQWPEVCCPWTSCQGHTRGTQVQGTAGQGQVPRTTRGRGRKACLTVLQPSGPLQGSLLWPERPRRCCWTTKGESRSPRTNAPSCSLEWWQGPLPKVFLPNSGQLAFIHQDLQLMSPDTCRYCDPNAV